MASTTIFYNDRFSRIPSNNILLALPPGIIVGNISGKVLMDAPLEPAFSLRGIILWLAIVLVFPAIASFYPAWNPG